MKSKVQNTAFFLRKMPKYLITAVLLEGELTGWRPEPKCFSFIVYPLGVSFVVLCSVFVSGTFINFFFLKQSLM